MSELINPVFAVIVDVCREEVVKRRATLVENVENAFTVVRRDVTLLCSCREET